MANVKISELLEAGVLDGLEDLPIVQDGVTVRCSTQDIADLAHGGKKYWYGLLSQTGTNAPTATVLQNTLGGNIVWRYDSTGIYYGTLTGAFPAGKTFVGPRGQAYVYFNGSGYDPILWTFERIDDNEVRFIQIKNDNTTTYNSFTNVPVFIIVFP